MRHLILAGFLAASLAAPPALAEPRPFVAVGVGLPELVHVEVGAFLTERLSLQLAAGMPVLNPLVGLSASYLAFGTDNGGRPPRHAFVVTGEVRINPSKPLELTSGGDRLGSAIGLYGGYSFIGDAGFLLRVQGGPIFDWEGGPAAGVNAMALVGWVL